MINNIDEAIKHCLEKAEEKKKEADYLDAPYGMDTSERTSCLDCANDHLQLAQWLTELKNYQDPNRKCSNCKYYSQCGPDYERYAQTTEGTLYKNKVSGVLKLVIKHPKCKNCSATVLRHFEPKEENKDDNKS